MRSKKVTHAFSRLAYRYGIFWPLLLGGISLFLIFCFGIFIFMFVEGWGLLDSFYQVVITLSTVGFTEVHELSDRGKFLVSVLILLGVGCFAYLVGSMSQVLVEGRLQMLLERRKMKKVIDSLDNHFIVCGYGRIGGVVVDEIIKADHPVVVIDNSPEKVRVLEQNGYLFSEGDATSDKTLLDAGLTCARALITALDNEAANVYVTLAARQLNPNLLIIARAEREESIRKLEFAGADRVLTPHRLGGLRMAQVVLRPTVTDFLELAGQQGNLDLQMEELRISGTSELVGRNLIESKIRPRFNVIIIAIKHADGHMEFNPKPESVLNAGDTMVVVGGKASLKEMQGIL